MTKDVTNLFMRLKLQRTTNEKPYLCPAKSMKYDFADSQCVFSVVTVKNSPNPLFTNKILETNHLFGPPFSSQYSGGESGPSPFTEF